MRILVFALAVLLLAPAISAAPKKEAYWASIGPNEARMRTGPGRQFPASWVYRRAGLPVKVIDSYPNWRKIEDPSGTQGWMQANLISEVRTALVMGDIRPLREKPDSGARVLWRAEPGVVGRLSDCARGWCKIDVRGRMGYVEAAHIWGGD